MKSSVPGQNNRICDVPYVKEENTWALISREVGTLLEVKSMLMKTLKVCGDDSMNGAFSWGLNLNS